MRNLYSVQEHFHSSFSSNLKPFQYYFSGICTLSHLIGVFAWDLASGRGLIFLSCGFSHLTLFTHTHGLIQIGRRAQYQCLRFFLSVTFFLYYSVLWTLPVSVFLGSHSTSPAQEHSSIFKHCLWTVECWLSQVNKEETPSVDIPSPKDYCPFLTYVLCLNSRYGCMLVKWPRKWRCLLSSLTLDQQVERNNSYKVFFDHKAYMFLGMYRPFIHILKKCNRIFYMALFLCCVLKIWGRNF